MQNKVSKQELADSLPDMDKYKVEITQLICQKQNEIEETIVEKTKILDGKIV